MWTVFKQALRLWKTNASDTAIVLKGDMPIVALIFN